MSTNPQTPPDNPTEEDIRNLQTYRPQTPRELWLYIKTIWGVTIPWRKVCPEPAHTPPFTAMAEAYFATAPISVWIGARGLSGKSLSLAVLSLTEQVTLGASVNLLGGSGEQSKRVHDYLTGADPAMRGRLWEAPWAPTWMLTGRGFEDMTQRESRTLNGGVLRALKASQTSIRGPHPSRLRGDEVEELDLPLLDAALGQTMARDGVSAQTVLSSTWHIPNGTMTEVLRRAKERAWPVRRWCWRCTMHTAENPEGWLDPTEVERKRTEVTDYMFRVEYDLQAPSSEGRAFSADTLARLFCGEELVNDVINQEYVFIPPGQGQYYHGADWAKVNDMSIICTFLRSEKEGEPDRLAAWCRMGKIPWPEMVDRFNRRVLEYGGPAAHDCTGIGSVVDDYLTISSTGFNFSSTKNRNDMLIRYMAAVEQRKQVCPRIEWAFLEHMGVTLDDLFSPGGHIPDSIAAAALAWLARDLGDAPMIARLW